MTMTTIDRAVTGNWALADGTELRERTEPAKEPGLASKAAQVVARVVQAVTPAPPSPPQPPQPQGFTISTSKRDKIRDALAAMVKSDELSEADRILAREQAALDKLVEEKTEIAAKFQPHHSGDWETTDPRETLQDAARRKLDGLPTEAETLEYLRTRYQQLYLAIPLQQAVVAEQTKRRDAIRSALVQAAQPKLKEMHAEILGQVAPLLRKLGPLVVEELMFRQLTHELGISIRYDSPQWLARLTGHPEDPQGALAFFLRDAKWQGFIS